MDVVAVLCCKPQVPSEEHLPHKSILQRTVSSVDGDGNGQARMPDISSRTASLVRRSAHDVAVKSFD